MSGDTQDSSQTDWEGEGGSTEPQPKQTTPQGLESVPKRKEVMDAFRKIVHAPKKD